MEFKKKKKANAENHNILVPHLHNIKIFFPSLHYRLNVHSFKFIFIFLLSDVTEASNDSDNNDDDECLCLCSQDARRKEDASK